MTIFSPQILVRGRQVVVSAGNSAAYTNFIARTSGLDASHLGYYATLLNGLTTDGLFNSDGSSSFLEALYGLPTQGATNALLNLVSSSFALLANNTPTFTTDRGYTFGGNASPSWLDTQFAPSAGTLFTQNDAHFGVWTRTQGSNSTKQDHGSINGGATNGAYVSNASAVGDPAVREVSINDAFGTSLTSSFTAGPGFILGNRTGATTREMYWNGAFVVGDSQASTTRVSDTLWIGARDFGGGSNQASDEQVMFASIGKSLTATQVGNLYSRLNAFKTSVGA